MFSKFFLGGLCVLGGFNSIAIADPTTSEELDTLVKNIFATGTLDFPQDPTTKKFDVYLVDTKNDNTLTQVRALNADNSFFYRDFTLTIDGHGGSLFGDRSPPGQKSAKGNPVRGFFVGGASSAGSTSGVIINNVFFTGCGAIGGMGGGGGMGAGGGLYVGEGTKVFINNCTFRSCIAQGGIGTNKGGIGGGGMRGFGGVFGGGGFGGNGGVGGGGGASSFKDGNATSGSIIGTGAKPGGDFNGNRDPAGGPGIGGNRNSNINDETNGGFGGGGGFNLPENTNGGSGQGGYGSGGGYTQSSPGLAPSAGSPICPIKGSDGGFGGGGGNGKLGENVFNCSQVSNQGGNGGFGGGGGKGDSGGKGGFGGGDGTSAIAGNGAAFGGAIFMEPSAELTIGGTFMLSSNSATQPMGNGNPGLALGNDIFMMSTSLLTFDTTSDVFLGNPLEGNQGDQTPDAAASTATGGLTKKGSKTLGLVGDNTYTGTTSVEGGELQIQGSVVSNVDVKSGTKLTGIFEINQDNTKTNGGNLTNDGFFSPNIATIEKTYTNESSGVFNVDITPFGILSPPFVTVGEKAKINGGKLEVFVGQGNYIAGTLYTLIEGTVDGAFDGNNQLNLMGPGKDSIKLAVSSGSLLLTVETESLFQTLGGPVPTPIVFPSNTANQVVESLKQSNHPPGSDLALAIESLGTLSISEQNKALPTLSARQFGSLEWVNARNNSYVADILSQHLFELCCTPRDCCTVGCTNQGFVTVFGNMMNNQKRLDELQRYNADSVGVLVGMDGCISERFIWGGAFGYTRTDILWKNHVGGGDTDSYYASLYGSLNACNCFQADIAFLGGGTFNDLERNIVFANVDRTARSDFWSYFVTTHLGLRYDWLFCCHNFEPFANMDYHYYMHGKTCEKGADSLNLEIKKKTQHMMRGELGLKWSYEFDCGCYCYAPYVGISWVGEFPLGTSKQPASFKNENYEIDALSYDSSVQLGAPQAGIKWSHCNGASFLLGYKGLYNGSVRINEVEGRFEWIF